MKGAKKVKTVYEFSGKLVLVTGSSFGIGYAIAREFYQSGARVVINSRSAKTTEEAIKRMKDEVKEAKKGAELHAAVGDNATKEGCNAVIKAVDALGDLDILINNTGIFKQASYDQASDEIWEEHLQVNLMSGVRFSRYYLPRLLRRNAGRIIFISSVFSKQPYASLIHGSVTKAAQVTLARGFAELCKGTQVTVNSVLAGATRTEGFVREYAGGDKATFAAMVQGFPQMCPESIIGRFLEPEEIAEPVLFLCTDAAVGINGHAQRVDGGFLRHI